MVVGALDLGPPEWYKSFAVKSTAATALEPRIALDATLGRGTFTAYYWRFT
jgi:hypothetical protein